MSQQQKPIANLVKLEELRQDPEFREFWAGTLKGIRAFNMNEAVLAHAHKSKFRVGDINAINGQAALDMHRLEGILELWETLLTLLEDRTIVAPFTDLEEED